MGSVAPSGVSSKNRAQGNHGRSLQRLALPTTEPPSPEEESFDVQDPGPLGGPGLQARQRSKTGPSEPPWANDAAGGGGPPSRNCRRVEGSRDSMAGPIGPPGCNDFSARPTRGCWPARQLEGLRMAAASNTRGGAGRRAVVSLSDVFMIWGGADIDDLWAGKVKVMMLAGHIAGVRSGFPDRPVMEVLIGKTDLGPRRLADWRRCPDPPIPVAGRARTRARGPVPPPSLRRPPPGPFGWAGSGRGAGLAISGGGNTLRGDHHF